MKAFATAVLLAAVVPANTQPAAAKGGRNEAAIDRWSGHIREASERFGIPESWIRRVIRAESGGRLELGGRPITSRAGAMGLMQLMPETWTEMRSKYRLGPDPRDPRDNILAGTAYLRAMFDRFGYPGLFAAYNAGPGRYQEHLVDGRPLPRETVAYLTQLEPNPAGTGSGLQPISGRELFVRLSRPNSEGRSSRSPAATGRGFDRDLFAAVGPSPER